MERTLSSLDGNTQRLDGGAMFGNAPRSLWERWAKPDDKNRIALACRCLLVEEPHRKILFEAGIGAFFSPPLRERYGVQEDDHVLLRRIEAMGLSASDIDVVVLSHLHFDHAGGVVTRFRESGALELAFPRATFVVGARAFHRAVEPHPRDRVSFVPEIIDLLENSGRLELISEPELVSKTLGPDYRFRLSDGHTPGLLISEVPSVNGPIVFASDLIPGTAWVRRSITMGYDRFPELLIDEKTRLLEDWADRGGRLFFTHDPEIALGKLGRDEAGQVVLVDTTPALRRVVA